MYIKTLKIKNYKIFKEFEIEFNSKLNIIVGDNEAGKSTILEAVHLALSSTLNSRYLKNEISENLFNKEIVQLFIDSCSTSVLMPLPSIEIEIFFADSDSPLYEGDNNSKKCIDNGLVFKIEFNEEYLEEYNSIDKSTLLSLPVEYYKVTWTSFARNRVTSRSIPYKSILIDSSLNRYKNGSDIYIEKIIKENLDNNDNVNLSQAYRRLKEIFNNNSSIQNINEKITESANISNKDVSISVDMSAKNSWESQLITYIDNVPFHQVGQGEQSIIKTNLSLSNNRAVDAGVVLIEEPENHLSYSKLNQLVNSILEKCDSKQILITTHSSFVANKLSLENLILLNNQLVIKLNDLDPDTYDYFQKLSGYETLRLILCKRAILVEGPSDELIVQRAYKDIYNKLPIEDAIDVISVKGLSFKRFLEIAKRLKKNVAVITDNDGNYNHCITQKYLEYIDIPNILISADQNNNLTTLEPQLVHANINDRDNFCKILGLNSSDYDSEEKISNYMIAHKTEVALKFFNAKECIKYPQYINDVIEWCNG